MRLPHHSTLAAYGALFIALGGTSYAAVELGRDSVSGKHIKRNAIGASELRRGAVTSTDLRDRGIRRRDLHRSARPHTDAQIAQTVENTMTSEEVLAALSAAVEGEPGAPGAQGPAGPAGPSGVIGVVARTATSPTIASGSTGGVAARCQAGERVLGGGARFEADGQAGDVLRSSYPLVDGEQGWSASYWNNGPAAGRVVTYALCAPTS